MGYNLSMNGNEVREICSTLGLSPQHLASLVGVHLTTVYRWEGQAASELRLEPLQHRLLLQLQKRAQVGQPKDLGRQLIECLLVGGTLVGLAYLLADLVETKPRRMSR